jgi:beta-glucanase (GH16 family)
MIAFTASAFAFASGRGAATTPFVSDARGDANGSRGLDVASVAQSQHHDLLRFHLTTYDFWRPALLKRGRVAFYFRFGRPSVERGLEIRYRAGRLEAQMTDSAGRNIGSGRARQINRHALLVEFSRGLLDFGAQRYRWSVSTSLGCNPGNGKCGDTFPARGRWITSRILGPAVPPQIAGRGYRQVFGDEFDSFDPSVWSRSIWWQPPAPSSDVYVRESSLHLVSRRKDGYPWRNVTTSLSSKQSRSFRGGYFEARMRWTGATDASPAFWLLSTQWRSTGSCPPGAAEIDIFERVDPSVRSHNGALHRNSAKACSVPDEFNDDHLTKDVGADLASGFHTYAALWTSSTVTWYVDGQELKHASVYDSTDQEMFIILSIGLGGWSSAAPASAELETDVDWVRVWQERP